jgi:protein-disulfide isomerase
VQRDVDSGGSSGVSGTPAFFVNGRLHEGSFDAGSLMAALEAS